MNYVPVPNSVRLLLAAFAVLAIAMIISPTNQPASAQDAPAGQRTVVLKDALLEYAKAKGMPLIVEQQLLNQLGEIHMFNGPEDVTGLVPSFLHEKRLGLATDAGTLKLLPISQIHQYSRMVNDHELVTADPHEWLSYMMATPGLDVNKARTLIAPMITREATVMPVNLPNSGHQPGYGFLWLSDRAESLRRIKSFVNAMSSRALAQPDLVVISIPKEVDAEEAAKVFRSAAGISGELFDNGKRFIGTCDPGTGEAKRETLQRLLAEMSKK